MVMTLTPERTIALHRTQVMKILTGMLLMLVFFLCGSQAQGEETHYIDKFIDSGGNKGKPDYIKFGAVRINLNPGEISDDKRVELTDDFDSDNFDLNLYPKFFESQRVIDLFYGVTALAADTGTAPTATGGTSSALAMLSVINHLFIGNRDTAINRLYPSLDSGEQPYAEASFNYLVKNSENQVEEFTMAFYGFWLRQNNAANLPADRTNLAISFGDFIQAGINHRVANTEQASQQNISINFNHFEGLHSDEGIVQFFREQDVATTLALAVGLYALLETPPSDQPGDRTIEQILSASPVLPLAQQTLVALLGRQSAPDNTGDNTGAPSLTIEDLLSPIYFPWTLGSFYKNYRQSKEHKIPEKRIPFLFFLAIGASSFQNSTSSLELNQLVINRIFGTDLYGATCDNTPTSESGAVITREELDTVVSNLTRYLETLGSDAIIPEQIPNIVRSIRLELQSVNRLEPGSFIQSERGETYTNLASLIAKERDEPKTSLASLIAKMSSKNLSAEALLLRGLFRGYFETFSTALQRLADGDRESQEVRALIALLNVIIEAEGACLALPSPVDQLNKRQPPSGGAGSSLFAP